MVREFPLTVLLCILYPEFSTIISATGFEHVVSLFALNVYSVLSGSHVLVRRKNQ